MSVCLPTNLSLAARRYVVFTLQILAFEYCDLKKIALGFTSFLSQLGYQFYLQIRHMVYLEYIC